MNNDVGPFSCLVGMNGLLCTILMVSSIPFELIRTYSQSWGQVVLHVFLQSALAGANCHLESDLRDAAENIFTYFI